MTLDSRPPSRLTLAQKLYPIAQRGVQALPAWLLRVRPFAIYQFRVKGESLLSKPEQTRNTERQVRWVASSSEAQQLRPIAADENIAAWNGDSCRAIAVWQGDRPVGAAWVAADTYHESELGLEYRLADSELWLYAAVVDPQFRRQGIYQQLWQFLIGELQQSHIDRVLVGVSAGNRSSQMAHLAVGAEMIGGLWALKTLGFGVVRIQGALLSKAQFQVTWRKPLTLSFGR